MAINLSPAPVSSPFLGNYYFSRAWTTWFSNLFSYVTRQRPSVTVSSSTTLSPLTYGDCEILVDSAAGITITLPAAVGSGQRYNLNIVTTITSGSTIVVTTSPDKLVGKVYQTWPGVSFLAYVFNGTTHTTLTLNGGVSGGIVGDRIQLIDLKPGIWYCMSDQQSAGGSFNPIS